MQQTRPAADEDVACFPWANTAFQTLCWKRGIEPPPFNAADTTLMSMLCGLLDGSAEPPHATAITRAIAVQIWLLVFEAGPLKGGGWRTVYILLASLALGRRVSAADPAVIKRLQSTARSARAAGTAAASSSNFARRSTGGAATVLCTSCVPGDCRRPPRRIPAPAAAAELGPALLHLREGHPHCQHRRPAVGLASLARRSVPRAPEPRVAEGGVAASDGPSWRCTGIFAGRPTAHAAGATGGVVGGLLGVLGPSGSGYALSSSTACPWSVASAEGKIVSVTH